MANPPKYRQGRLVWALLRSRKGKKEKHPAIIITADRDIIQPERFDPRRDVDKVNAVAVVGVSTQYRKYPPYVQLPYSPDRAGHATTKLTEDCGACVGWYDWVVLEEDVLGCGGDVPASVMDRIMDAIAEDFRRKLVTKADRLTKELAGINGLLEALIGSP